MTVEKCPLSCLLLMLCDPPVGDLVLLSPSTGQRDIFSVFTKNSACRQTFTRLFFMLNNWPLWHLCTCIGYIFRVIYLRETVGITRFCCLHGPIFPVAELSWRLSSRWMSSAPAYTSADRDVTALPGSHDEVGAPFLALIAISSV